MVSADATKEGHVDLFAGNSVNNGIIPFIANGQNNVFQSWLNEHHDSHVYQRVGDMYEPFDKFDETIYRDTALGAQPAQQYNSWYWFVWQRFKQALPSWITGLKLT